MAAGTVSPESTPQRKPLDVNKYATKKTIAQGMLDIALLTANASQLKYILQVGEKHEFYSLMLGLISISIILQVCQAIIGTILGSALNINKEQDQENANKINNVVLAINVVVTALNIIISAFDMRSGDHLNTNSTETSRLSILEGDPNITYYDVDEPYLSSYQKVSNADNWMNATYPEELQSKLYQEFVDVFNKIREIYARNQSVDVTSGYVLNSDNVNQFMDKILNSKP